MLCVHFRLSFQNFLDGARQKFIGFRVPQDMTTLYGLPEPIHEAVRVLREYHYTSLGEVQIKKEAEYNKYPLLLVSTCFTHTCVAKPNTYGARAVDNVIAMSRYSIIQSPNPYVIQLGAFCSCRICTHIDLNFTQRCVVVFS